MKFLKSNVLIDLFQNQKLSKKYKMVSIDNQTKELIELYNKNHSEANLKLNEQGLDHSLDVYNDVYV